MPIQLGAAFTPRVIVEEPVHEVSVESLQSEMLLSALLDLRSALDAMPTPVVHVDQPDLSAIVTAVNGIKGPADAEQIAKAIKAELLPGERPHVDTVLEELTEALKRLDFRLKGIGSGGGGGGGVTSRIQNEPNTSLETREAAQDARYEWQGSAGASVPLYIGTAPPGTATSAAAWKVDKYTYIAGPAGDAVPSIVQTAVGAWDNRATLF